MGVSDGGGSGGDSVGSLSGQIAAAAAKAELEHQGWEPTGEYSCRRSVRPDVISRPDASGVQVNTLTGEITLRHQGVVEESVVTRLAEAASAVVAKWHPTIDELFACWRELPGDVTPSAPLRRAAREISVDPDVPGSVSATFVGVNERLAGDLECIKNRTAQLGGEYAQAFHEMFVCRLPATVAGQASLVASMSLACLAQGNVWSSAAADLADLERKALRAMKAAGPAGDGSGGDLVLGLTVVAAVAAALAAVPSLGTSATLFGALSGLASVAAAAHGLQQAPVLPIGAGHPDDVLKNLVKSVRRINKGIREQELLIRDLLLGALGFATGGSAEVDRHPLVGAPLGRVLAPRQDLIVNAVSIASITELWLPSVAADLRQAQRHLTVVADDGFRRPGAIGMGPEGAWSTFSQVQEQTSTLLLQLAADVEAAAGRLAEAAAHIGRADDDISDRLGRVERIVERHNLNDSDAVAALL